MSKFKVGDRVIIKCFYEELATGAKYKLEDIGNTDIRKAIEKAIPQTIYQVKEGTSSGTTYDIKFGLHTENFFEEELSSAIIENWQEEFAE